MSCTLTLGGNNIPFFRIGKIHENFYSRQRFDREKEVNFEKEAESGIKFAKNRINLIIDRQIRLHMPLHSNEIIRGIHVV